MLELIEKLPKSERRWVRSFEMVNAIFWLVPLSACVMQSGDCGMAFLTFPMLMYAPYWFWRLPFPTIDFGMFIDGLLMVASGLVAHFYIARFLGRRFKDRVPAWHVSIPSAIGIIVIGSVSGLWLIDILGLL
jgi:hypothetical protein